MDQAADSRPNVLLITTDHWSGRFLGAAGHSAIQTPTLDELTRCGVRFSNAYSETPVCIPARRTLMTGLTPRGHGDRVFKERELMPDAPTLAQTFRNAGYQAQAVGKLHVYPQRDRIGFDDVLLDEEGRNMYGVVDDYDIYLADEGFPGQQYEHGMSNNQYWYRPWHLPDETHATNWATRSLARMIRRRDPTRPAFWYLSFRHPHPPLVPLQTYLDFYRDLPIDESVVGDWAAEGSPLSYALQAIVARGNEYTPAQLTAAKRAFYALCTHIDHQLRILIGTLREEDLLNNTIICFTADHGDMLGDQRMLAKRVFYENSAKIPMILVPPAKNQVVVPGLVDNRLVGLQDVMPTLLELCGITVPRTVEGQSMLRKRGRKTLYGECSEGDHSTRMVHDGRHKLIYYPLGNVVQLFDLQEDPDELRNVARDKAYKGVTEALSQQLISELYNGDERWAKGGKLVGLPDKPFVPGPNLSLSSQRGYRWPLPPQTNQGQIEWSHETMGPNDGPLA